MERHELLRDITYFGTLWAAVFGADLAGAPDPIKYLIAGLWTFVVAIGGIAYFGWDRLYRRRSFLKVSVFGVLTIGLLIYSGYVVDNLALNTWQWFSYGGVLVVTWANLFGLLLLFTSAMAYYLALRVGSTIADEVKQIRQEEVEATALRAAEQLSKLVEAGQKIPRLEDLLKRKKKKRSPSSEA